MILEVPTLPDYKELYFTLLRETEFAIRTLITAQQHCENLLLSDAETDETSD